MEICFWGEIKKKKGEGEGGKGKEKKKKRKEKEGERKERGGAYLWIRNSYEQNCIRKEIRFYEIVYLKGYRHGNGDSCYT